MAALIVGSREPRSSVVQYSLGHGSRAGGCGGRDMAREGRKICGAREATHRRELMTSSQVAVWVFCDDHHGFGMAVGDSVTVAGMAEPVGVEVRPALADSGCP